MYVYLKKEILGQVDNSKPLSSMIRFFYLQISSTVDLNYPEEKNSYMLMVFLSFLASFSGTAIPFRITESIQKAMHRWYTTALPFHTMNWRPTHFWTPDKLCLMRVGSSVTRIFTDLGVHRHGVHYVNMWSTMGINERDGGDPGKSS